jgi:lipoprotein NlpD
MTSAKITISKSSMRAVCATLRPAALLLSGLLAACTITATREAPVTDRSARPVSPSTAAQPPVEPGKPAVPRVAPADGIYVVQPGDTLFSVASSFGREVKDLARWNNLDDPAKIGVGQNLRVVPPAGETAAVMPVTPTGPATTRPLEGGAAAGAPPAAAPAAEPATAPGPLAAVPESKPPLPVPSSDWIWPVNGRVIEKFDEKRNKGIGIAGREGDPVVASADGQVVYSGSGLRGYGNLVILKHNDDFISAYAHNRQILVKQGQMVKRGQRIAEVGRSDATQPKLHFEIRRQGKPVDPLAYLPPR